ncbi:3-oxoacyl-[acyl-carrier-protein] reductase [Proteiniborus ethanoligenes]|uniref:3-oxoacyl-[acyl-carrier-protein] reductase n=1 Tax=Proteiniborus ethanoligenes TaxID=415015 RepID=A0A1H3PMG7_9FIRM|nr:3-oxoacyl-[acyl-carrier-protein] reductase [Proteiniborus ethanoligenes]SDZ02131.1 3-oxoacyl-[acyl-carrier-protein] reductase [Proteiniborus ethanoligenes]
MDLRGKTALVTGGSRGIGRAIAIKLASLGSDILFSYSSNEEKAKEVQVEIEKMGRRVLAVKADVSKMDNVESLVIQGMNYFSKIDILVNNAGVTKDNLLMRMTEEEWDDVINVNLKGTFNVTKSLIRNMLKQKECSIINVASIVGASGNAGQCNYAASKAGIIGFTKSLAKEVAKKNIRVNAVAPGFISTDMTEKLPEKIVNEYLEKIPLQKLGEPEDIANAVAFLASDMSKYITGQIIVVDGGILI